MEPLEPLSPLPLPSLEECWELIQALAKEAARSLVSLLGHSFLLLVSLFLLPLLLPPAILRMAKRNLTPFWQRTACLLILLLLGGLLIKFLSLQFGPVTRKPAVTSHPLPRSGQMTMSLTARP